METDIIHRDPEIMMGKPVVRGTRITVEHILRQMGHGATFAEVMSDYQLTEAQVSAALEYAAGRLALAEMREAV